MHLTVGPVRDPDRNRLREVYADKATNEVTRLIAHDQLDIGRHKWCGDARTFASLENDLPTKL